MNKFQLINQNVPTHRSFNNLKLETLIIQFKYKNCPKKLNKRKWSMSELFK